jgi:hypothetical protein
MRMFESLAAVYASTPVNVPYCSVPSEIPSSSFKSLKTETETDEGVVERRSGWVVQQTVANTWKSSWNTTDTVNRILETGPLLLSAEPQERPIHSVSASRSDRLLLSQRTSIDSGSRRPVTFFRTSRNDTHLGVFMAF